MLRVFITQITLWYTWNDIENHLENRSSCKMMFLEDYIKLFHHNNQFVMGITFYRIIPRYMVLKVNFQIQSMRVLDINLKSLLIYSNEDKDESDE